MTALLAAGPAAVCVFRAGWGDVAMGAASAFGTVLALACVAAWMAHH